MPKKMLFNAAHTDEPRVAVIDGRTLCDISLGHATQLQKKANIYKAKITRIEPSLEAAFVDYGQERHGFLPLKEVAQAYQENTDNELERQSISDVLKEGQILLVQVDKEERGTKGAALSTFISLAGSYLVLIPNSPYAGGISRRIEGDERDHLRDMLRQLNTPAGMGIIIRTAGVGKNLEELQWDLDYLLKLWEAITQASDAKQAPCLIHQESDACVRAVRDYLRNDITEILVDDEETLEKVKRQVAIIRPALVDSVKLYKESTPLFTRYQIETQIENIFKREVRLPSGGAIVIDRTEALISIDVNSSKATQGGDIEDTALHTNLEAVDEVARQLRLRDLGGLVVIDLIDMSSTQNQKSVEARLRRALTEDRARIQTLPISALGLLEMSRQRLRSSLAEATQNICPRCHGRGTLRSVESIAISIMRLVEETASKPSTGQVQIHVPVDVGTYILNEKRADIVAMEERHGAHLLIIPNQHMESPKFKIRRFKDQTQPLTDSSYQLSTTPEFETPESLATTPPPEVPAVRLAKPGAPPRPKPAAAPHAKKQDGLLTRILRKIFGTQPVKPEKKSTSTARKQTHHPRRKKPHRNNASQNRNGPRTPRTQQSRQGGSRNTQRNRSNNRNKSGQNSATQKTTENQPQEGARQQDGRRVGQYRRRTQTKESVNPQVDPAETKQHPPAAAPQKRKPRNPRPARPRTPAKDSAHFSQGPEATESTNLNTQPIKAAAKPPTKRRITPRKPSAPAKNTDGYQQVETAEKPTVAATTTPATPRKPRRPRRRPTAKTATTNEPLMMVETQKKASDKE
jgi:ribonuclease E